MKPRSTKLRKVSYITKRVFLIPVLAVCILTMAARPLNRLNGIRTIVIDAGHGGHDPGCMHAGSREKDVTLNIALELGKKLEALLPDVRVIYTRKTDKFVPLIERAQIANKSEADLFISIHCNSHKNTAINGTETFAMGLHKADDNLDVAKRENEVVLLEDNYQETYQGFDPNSPESHIIFSLYQNAYLDKSLKFASKVENELNRELNRSSRGVKQAGFVVLWQTKMPSVLIETGFLSNRNDRDLLTTTEGVQKVADGIAHAVVQMKRSSESISSSDNR